MLLRRCEHGYTLRDSCDRCGAVPSAHPPRYSPKHAEARAKAKLKALKGEEE